MLVSALPATAAPSQPTKPHPVPAITTSFHTNAVSGVGRETTITITSSGQRPLHVFSISQNGFSIPKNRFGLKNSCVQTTILPQHTCIFRIGWAGGPGGSPPGPTVTIVSNAPTSPTVIEIPYQ